MDYNTLINEIFQVCIIPLLGILTTYLVKYLKQKSEEIAANTDDKLTQKYTQLIMDTITKCVIATNQTYVESLKNQGKFDKEAQEKAFNMTLSAVLAILSTDCQKFIELTYGDLNEYLRQQIEAQVNESKKSL